MRLVGAARSEGRGKGACRVVGAGWAGSALGCWGRWWCWAGGEVSKGRWSSGEEPGEVSTISNADAPRIVRAARREAYRRPEIETTEDACNAERSVVETRNVRWGLLVVGRRGEGLGVEGAGRARREGRRAESLASAGKRAGAGCSDGRTRRCDRDGLFGDGGDCMARTSLAPL